MGLPPAVGEELDAVVAEGLRVVQAASLAGAVARVRVGELHLARSGQGSGQPVQPGHHVDQAEEDGSEQDGESRLDTGPLLEKGSLHGLLQVWIVD